MYGPSDACSTTLQILQQVVQQQQVQLLQHLHAAAVALPQRSRAAAQVAQALSAALRDPSVTSWLAQNAVDECPGAVAALLNTPEVCKRSKPYS